MGSVVKNGTILLIILFITKKDPGKKARIFFYTFLLIEYIYCCSFCIFLLIRGVISAFIKSDSI